MKAFLYIIPGFNHSPAWTWDKMKIKTDIDLIRGLYLFHVMNFMPICPPGGLFPFFR